MQFTALIYDRPYDGACRYWPPTKLSRTFLAPRFGWLCTRLDRFQPKAAR